MGFSSRGPHGLPAGRWCRRGGDQEGTGTRSAAKRAPGESSASMLIQDGDNRTTFEGRAGKGSPRGPSRRGRRFHVLRGLFLIGGMHAERRSRRAPSGRCCPNGARSRRALQRSPPKRIRIRCRGRRPAMVRVQLPGGLPFGAVRATCPSRQCAGGPKSCLRSSRTDSAWRYRATVSLSSTAGPDGRRWRGTASARWLDIVRAGERFHRALAGILRSGEMRDARRDRWARADRQAW
jgi:hypothetical protein